MQWLSDKDDAAATPGVQHCTQWGPHGGEPAHPGSTRRTRTAVLADTQGFLMRVPANPCRRKGWPLSPAIASDMVARTRVLLRWPMWMPYGLATQRVIHPAAFRTAGKAWGRHPGPGEPCPGCRSGRERIAVAVAGRFTDSDE